jgi:hypothetical protein
METACTAFAEISNNLFAFDIMGYCDVIMGYCA